MISLTSNVLSELESTLTELEQLTSKPVLSSKDEKRHAFLISKVAILRDHAKGTSLAELKAYEKDRILRDAGLNRMPDAPRTRMAEDIQQEYRDWLSGKPVRTANIPKDSEVRANEAGQQSITYTQKAPGGSFVPTGFWDRFSAVMKQADDIFQPWASNYLETETGATTPCPMVDDTAAASTIVGETVQSTEIDVQDFANITLNAYTFRSGLVAISRELLQDWSFPLGPVIDNLMAQRHARGVGKFLITGTGINQPTGLLPGIVAAGVNPVIASGSSSNDGSSNTGSNSIGTIDLQKCFFSVNAQYRRNAVWFMNDATLQSIASLLDKAGHPLLDLMRGFDFANDKVVDIYTIMGKRIAICPSMPNIASAANPIVFGDPSYFIFRSVPSSAYLQIFQEAGGTPGTFDLILRDLVGLQSFFRADSNVLIANSLQSPFGFIQSHS